MLPASTSSMPGICSTERERSYPLALARETVSLLATTFDTPFGECTWSRRAWETKEYLHSELDFGSSAMVSSGILTTIPLPREIEIFLPFPSKRFFDLKKPSRPLKRRITVQPPFSPEHFPYLCSLGLGEGSTNATLKIIGRLNE